MRKTSEKASVNESPLTSSRSSRPPLQINDWVLHCDLGVLRNGQKEVRLNAKTLHVLLVLLDAIPQGVSREHVLNQVWGERYPSDTVVSRAIADLRSAFGERAGEQRYIRTLPKFGYQLTASVGPVPSQPLQRRMRTRALAGLLTAVAGCLAILFWINLPSDQHSRIESPPPNVFRWGLPTVLTANPGVEQQPRLASDGRTVVYAAKPIGKSDWDLYRLTLDGGDPLPVAARPDIDEHGPALSPSARQMAYVQFGPEACNVVIQPLAAVAPKTVAQCTTRFPTLVDWSPDGHWLAYTTDHPIEQTVTRPLAIVQADGTGTRVLTSGITLTGTDYYPRFSPDSQRVAFLRGEPQPDHRATLWLVNLDNGKERALTTEPVQMGGHTWLDENTLLFIYQQAGRMLSSLVDTELGRSGDMLASNLIQPDVHVSHKMLLAVEVRRDRDLTILDGQHTRGVARSTEDDFNARWSPNEQWLAYISRRSGYDELWLTSADGGDSRRLSRFESANIRYLSWNKDNERLLFSVDIGGQESLHEINIISGSIQPLEGLGSDQTSPAWLPDGRSYVYGCLQWDWALCLYRNNEHRVLVPGMFRPQVRSSDTVVAIDNDGVLHEIDLTSGHTTVAFDGLPARGRLGWYWHGDTLFYLAPDHSGGGQLWQRTMSTGQASIRHNSASLMTDTLVDISRSGKIILTSSSGSADNLVTLPVY